jgi:hypothetical protein
MVMVLAATSSMTSAQGNQPQGSGSPDATTTAAMESAKALKESLTAEQVAAIKAVLDSHAAELSAITAQLPDPNAVSSTPRAYLPLVITNGSSSAQSSSSADAPKLTSSASLDRNAALLSVLNQSDALQATISAEVAALLTSDQQALDAKAFAPVKGARQALDKALSASSANVATPNSAETPDYYSTYCYYAGQYASYAAYYGYYGYLYGYYNYIYNTYGSYNAYYDLYYGRYYAFYGLREVAAGYFDLIILGSDFNGNVSAGLSDNYYAYYYTYYGYNEAYSNYSSYGYTYAYYAYYYGYYANQYAYNAYYYNYYCYYS